MNDPAKRDGEARRLASPRRYFPLALTVCVGVLVSVVASIMVGGWEQERIKVEFERQAGILAAASKSSLGFHLEVLYSIGSFFPASNYVDRQEFAEFVKQPLSLRPGIQALEWVPHVPGSKRPAFEAAARRDGHTDFRITERNTQGQMVKAARREEYFPVYYLEPLKGNEAALGFDLASEAARLKALARARDTGKATATGRISLVQETGKQHGVLVFMPIYRKGMRHDTLAERRESLHGFALGVFRIGDLVEASLRGLDRSGIDVHLYDRSAAAGEQFLYEARLPQRTPEAHPMIDEIRRDNRAPNWVETLDVGGRQWSLLFLPVPEYLTARTTWQTWGVLGGGLLFTALLGAYIFTVLGRTAQVERLVKVRTAELARTNQELESRIVERKRAEEALRASEDRYRDLVEHSEDLICTHDLNGTILSANQAMARSIGYDRAEELLGRKISDFLAPSVRDQFVGYLETIAKEDYAKGIMKIRTTSGEERLLEYQNSLRTEGLAEPIVRGRARDVTERRRAEAALARRTEQMQALRAMTVEITQQLDLTDLLDLVTRRAAELIGAVSGAIYLWNEATQILSAEAWRGLGEWMRGLRLGPGEGVAGAVAQRRRGLIVNDYRTSSYASPLFLERTRFTAVIAEPLLYHERLIGVLAVNNEGSRLGFAEEHGDLLGLFAAQAAIAIQNARLYDTVHQRAERIAAVNRLTRVISSSLDLGTVYGAFAKEVKHLIAYDRMGIVVPDASGEGLRIVQLTSDRPTTARRGSLWPKKAGTGVEWVMVHRKPQIERDLGEDRLFVEDEVLFREGIRSSVRLPLIAKGEVIGALFLDSTRPDCYAESDLELLVPLGEQLAIAIDNSRLYEGIQEDARFRTALAEVARTLTSMLEIDAISTLVCERMQSLFQVDGCYAWILDETARELVGTASVGHKAEHYAGLRVSLDQEDSLSARVARMRKPQVVQDVATSEFAGAPLATLFDSRSLLALPLMAKESLVGVVILNDVRKTHRFDEALIRRAEIFASQAAIAIENARLYVQAKKRELEATKLNEVTRQVASSLDLDHVLDQVTAMTVELLGCDASGIYMYDGTRGGLTFSRGLHLDPELTRDLVLASGEGVGGRAYQERRPIWTADRLADQSLQYSPATDRLVRERAPRAYLAVPIISRSGVHGVIVEYFFTPHDFSPQEVQLLSALADHTAVAIENARLHLDLRESKGKIEELYTLGVTMQEQMSLEKRLGLILTGARAVLGFDRINILLPDPEMKMLKAVASVGVEEPLEGIRVPLGPEGGGIAKAFLDRTEIVWEGSGSVPEDWRLGHPYSEIQAFRSKAFVNVPLIVGGRPIGVLGADNKATRKPISAERVRLLRTFAAQAALAIDNARLYDEVTGYAKELEQKVEERTKALKETQVQLIQSGKLAAVGTLAAGVAHELNQPLMVIRGYAQELLGDERIADEEIREDLGRIEAQTTRMSAIISHLRDFSRQSKGTRQVTDLNQVVTHAFTFLGQQLKTRNIEVVQELDAALPKVWADPLQIEQVLLNLVTNARDAMEKAGRGTITIRTEAIQNTRVVLSVTDTGPGIPPDLQGRIFDPFFTTKEVGKGTGLGLSICHGIAEEHGGELRVESPVVGGRGARFTLALPRSLRDSSGSDRT